MDCLELKIEDIEEYENGFRYGDEHRFSVEYKLTKDKENLVVFQKEYTYHGYMHHADENEEPLKVFKKGEETEAKNFCKDTIREMYITPETAIDSRVCGLKKKIDEKPLTKKDFLRIIKNNIQGFVFEKMECYGLLVNMKDSNSKHKMHINSLQDKKEQKLTIIHEVNHFFYEVFGFGTGDGEEILLEKEAQRFYENNKRFMDLFFERIK